MSARAIFFDSESAEAAIARLIAAGYAAEMVQERLAGEDDDEDHPYALLSDAPEVVLDLLTDEFDGWLDYEDPEPTAGTAGLSPLDLPSGPKRIKRPENLPDTLSP